MMVRGVFPPALTMADPLAASIVQALLALELAPIQQEQGNRFSLEGLTWRPGQDGAFEIGIRRFEAASLRLASGPLALEIGRVAIDRLNGRVRIEHGKPRLDALQAVRAELSDVKVDGPLLLEPAPTRSAGERATGHWCLGPLAAADGSIRAEIIDAHLLFDADVTVPVRQGRVDFNDAAVAHVGPNSRMGVSRFGLYVDAPNGRSYLYQFSSAPVSGVEYEQRGALLGPWVTSRGRLRLQPFGEALLRQGAGAGSSAVTTQARLLLDRTAVWGDLQLGDGKFIAPGLQAELVGRGDGRNAIRFQSQAVGRGLRAGMESLQARDAAWQAGDRQLRCDEIAGTLKLRLFTEDGQLRFAMELPKIQFSGIRLDPAQ